MARGFLALVTALSLGAWGCHALLPFGSGGPDSRWDGPRDAGGPSGEAPPVAERPCAPRCDNVCAGQQDGCGGKCPTTTCAGCCDAGGRCQPGTLNTICGKSGSTCKPCGAGQTCTAGSCGGGCTPSCSGKCKGEQDGCGGACPTNGCSGCCDPANKCQLGTTAAACGLPGAPCTVCPAPTVCINKSCCTPSCAQKCAGQSDGCAGTCATTNCTGCCLNKTCFAGDYVLVCGKSGQTCSNCTLQSQICQNGACAAPACGPANCMGGCCDGGGTCRTGDANSLCGKYGAACEDCASHIPSQICNKTTKLCESPTTTCVCPAGCCEGPTCYPGNTALRCGTGGVQCQLCYWGSCATGSCSKCLPGGCPAGTCCGLNGCVAGTDDQACGSIGQCDNCLAKGLVCRDQLCVPSWGP